LAVNTVAIVVAVASVLTIARLSPTSAASDYILMSRSQLLSLPTSGTAWNALKARADSSIGSPDLSNQDESADQTTLAKSLVFARTGVTSYRSSVIAALKAAVGTEAGGRTLALARNLPGYVLAADFIDLGSADASFDTNTFKPWLRRTLTENLSGKTLISTQEGRPNNWGTHAGAARAAVAAYLGDSAQLARTAAVFRGWLGDRTAYASFTYGDLSWQCSTGQPVGINPPCSKSGVDIGGALPDDMRRGGSLHWPPSATGYPWEALQGAVLEAEILRAQGYDAWSWSNKALLRAVRFLYERAKWPATGDDQWQTWLIDRRYGTSYHTPPPARGGKNFGFTDWLYGPSSGSSTPASTPAPAATPQPTAKPTTAPTATPSPTRSPSPTPARTPSPTGSPTDAATATPTEGSDSQGSPPDPSPTPDATPDPTPAPTAEPTPAPTEAPPPAPRPRPQASDPPAVSRPVVQLSASSDVPTAGVPVVVDWGLESADAGLQTYQLEYRIGAGDWVRLPLASPTSSVARHVLPSAHEIRYRVRAVDRNGEAGEWRSSTWMVPTALSDSSSAISYGGTWSFVNYSSYLNKRAHWTKARSATATYTFDGASVAWAGPVGPTRGKARVIVDGRLVATVDTYRATFKARDVLWAATLKEGRHTLRIQVLGTAGRPTVAVDGLYVLSER
jgi:hypothetical protein